MQRKVHALSCREKFTHFHVEKSSRTFMQKKSSFHVEKSARTWEILCLVHGISPIVFDPMVLVCGIASKSIEPKYWVCGIVSQWFWSMVLSEA